MHQRYAHAKQFKRATGARYAADLSGRVLRDIGRNIESNSGLEAAFATLLALAQRVRAQRSVSAGRRSFPAAPGRCIGRAAHRLTAGVKTSGRRSALNRLFGAHVTALPGDRNAGHALVDRDPGRRGTATYSRPRRPGISRPQRAGRLQVQGSSPAERRAQAEQARIAPQGRYRARHRQRRHAGRPRRRRRRGDAGHAHRRDRHRRRTRARSRRCRHVRTRSLRPARHPFDEARSKSSPAMPARPTRPPRHRSDPPRRQTRSAAARSGLFAGKAWPAWHRPEAARAR